MMDASKYDEGGFDVQAGLTWIYPTNYPVRDYQFNIIQQALFKNTLVSLPTGLGKTFIAAVVMFNFYRWYPTGKVIFMAPTRPLVKQQVDACYGITAIPRNDTAELTGAKQNSLRNGIWNENRVFFVTPQVLQNDLDKILELSASIKCVVFDEAHKAKGNYAYCEVVRKLKQQNAVFRVLALSATPGNTTDDFREVITNLMISHLELRTEESIDVQQYVFRRKLETVVVPLGEKLDQIKSDYDEILEKYVRTLVRYKLIQGNCANLTKGRIFMIKNEYQSRGNRDSNYNEIMKTLSICLTLYHAYELLIRHGLRGFLSFFEEHKDKPLLRGNHAIASVVNDVKDYLGSDLPNVDLLPDGTYPDVPSTVKFGHPKFYKLKEILQAHFECCDDKNSSRVIVFFEYRDSVMEAFVVLLQARPAVRAKVFLGQKSGITQRVQLNVIKSFREGTCNTLLSTSIGEEGLDVGEVDLIVCFDISNKSPIRMVQRMGRTGRKREGRIVVLVTEGKEQETLQECIRQKNAMRNWNGLSKALEDVFVESSRMVPKNIKPTCSKMHLTVTETSKKNTVKGMFKKISSGSSSPVIPDDIEMREFKEKLKGPFMFFDKGIKYVLDAQFDQPDYYSKYAENQRKFQSTSLVKSSDSSILFVELMKFSDSKRFNIPSTQDFRKCLKQGDIRAMFSKVENRKSEPTQPSQAEFLTQEMHNFAKSQPETPKMNQLHKELFIEIENYLEIQLSSRKTCRLCDYHFSCDVVKKIVPENVINELKNWIQPDFSVVENITSEALESYGEMPGEMNDSIMELEESDSFTKSFFDDKPFNFVPPKSLNSLLNNLNVSSTPSDDRNDEKLNELLLYFKTNINEWIEDKREGSTLLIEEGSHPASPVAIPQRERTDERLEEKRENYLLIDEKRLSPTTSSDCFSQKAIMERKSPPPVEEDDVSPSTSPILLSQKRSSANSTNSEKKLGPKSDGKSAPYSLSLTEFCDISSFFVQSGEDDKNIVEHSRRRKNSAEDISGQCKNLELEDVFDSSLLSDLYPDSSNRQTSRNNGRIQSQEYTAAEVKSADPIRCDEESDFEERSLLGGLSSFNLHPEKRSIQSRVKIKDTAKIDEESSDKLKTIDLEDLCDYSSFSLTQDFHAGLSNQNCMSTQKYNSPKNRKKIVETDLVFDLTSPGRSARSQTTKRNNANRASTTSKSLMRSGFKVPDMKRKRSGGILSSNSDNEFETIVINSQAGKNENDGKAEKKKKKRPRGCDLIDDQAEVSNDVILLSSDEHSDENLDSYDASFVNDETQNFLNNTEMYARYIQSSRSPLKGGALFKMPKSLPPVTSEIFSQDDRNPDDTYVNDSFCVDSDDVDETLEMSKLEMLEKQLEERKKKSQRKIEKKKRKRVIIHDSDSSD